jgi:hypothetical protein
MKSYTILIAALFAGSGIFAQNAKENEKKWDVSNPAGTASELEIVTNE